LFGEYSGFVETLSLTTRQLEKKTVGGLLK
jgi:hypothetical protein